MSKIKIILVVTGLLLTGFVAGFLTNRQLVRNHIERVRQWDREEQFGESILRRVEATAEQRTLLEPILDGYGREFHQLTLEQRQVRKAFFDSLHAEISPYLDDEQREKLQKMRRFIQRGPIRRGGPPHSDHSGRNHE